MKITVATLLILMCSLVHADLDRCDIMLGVSEAKKGGNTSSSVKWSLDTVYSDQIGDLGKFSLTLDSDYSTGDVEFDLLKTWWRYIPTSDREIKPVFLATTSGQHDFDDTLLMLGVGFRKDIPGGFAELSIGGSRDISGDDRWKGDFGLLIDFRRKFGKLNCSLRPQGAINTSSEARIRGGDVTYSVDFKVSYPLANDLSLGYHLLRTNSGGSLSSDQFIGISYSMPKK